MKRSNPHPGSTSARRTCFQVLRTLKDQRVAGEQGARPVIVRLGIWEEERRRRMPGGRRPAGARRAPAPSDRISASRSGAADPTGTLGAPSVIGVRARARSAEHRTPIAPPPAPSARNNKSLRLKPRNQTYTLCMSCLLVARRRAFFSSSLRKIADRKAAARYVFDHTALSQVGESVTESEGVKDPMSRASTTGIVRRPENISRRPTVRHGRRRQPSRRPTVRQLQRRTAQFHKMDQERGSL